MAALESQAADVPKVEIDLDITDATMVRAMLTAEIRLIEKHMRKGKRRSQDGQKPIQDYLAACQRTLGIVEAALRYTLAPIVKN